MILGTFLPLGNNIKTSDISLVLPKQKYDSTNIFGVDMSLHMDRVILIIKVQRSMSKKLAEVERSDDYCLLWNQQ